MNKIILGGSRIAARKIPFRCHRLSEPRPIVAFSFDDFAASAADNAAPVLEDAGMRGTFYLSSAKVGTEFFGRRMVSCESVRALAARGHEIGAHTHDHINVQQTPIRELRADVRQNIEFIRALDPAEAPMSFAYPYGILSLRSKLALMNVFPGLRGIEPGINAGLVDLTNLRAQELYDVSSDGDRIEALLDEAQRRCGWLIFYTHDVQANPSNIGCSPRYFAEVVARVRRRGLLVETVADTLRRIGATAKAQI